MKEPFLERSIDRPGRRPRGPSPSLGAVRTGWGRLSCHALLGAAAILAWPLPCVGRAADVADVSMLEEQAIQAAAAAVAPSTVRIEPVASAAGAANDAATTGLVIAEPGWVVTSSFGLGDADREAVVITSDGRRRAGRIRGRDLSRRVVLMEVAPADGLSAPPLESGAPPLVGAWAIALGRGWSAGRAGISTGIVSADGRVWGRAIQTDAAVSPANYGGPLVDIRGRVVGILSPLPADTAGMPLGSELYDSGIGFAVPVGDVLAILPRLQAGETLRPGILGISYASPDPFTAPAVVASSRAGSPAARAGLRPGDRIVSANATPVDTIASFRQIIGPLYAGDRLAIEVRRTTAAGEAATIPLEATLVDELPPYRRPALGIALQRPLRTGRRTVSPDRTPPRADDAESDEEASASPPTVRWVWPESPAARAGVQAGDVILSIAATDQAADDPAGGTAPQTEARPDAATSGGAGGVAALLRGTVASEEIGTVFRVGLRRNDATLSFDMASVPLPTGVPAPLWKPDGAGTVEGPARASLERLEAADVEQPAIVVLPPGGASEAVGALVVLGDAKATVDERMAEPWLVPAASHGVAVVLLRAADGEWGRADIRAAAKALEILAARRAVDASRVAVAGLGTGAEAAWTIGEALAGVTRGIAVLEGHLPRRGTIPAADPARPLSVLLSEFGPDRGDVEAGRRAASDRRRLSEGAIPWGAIGTRRGEWPVEELCRWVESLGIL